MKDRSRSFNTQAWIDLKQFARLAYYLNASDLLQAPSVSGVIREALLLLETSLDKHNLLPRITSLTEAVILLKSLGITLKQLEPGSKDRTLIRELQREEIASSLGGDDGDWLDELKQPPQISRQVRLLRVHEELTGDGLVRAIDSVASGETDQMGEEEFEEWLKTQSSH